MGDYGHVTSWNGLKVGRERQALALWADALDFYEKAKANGLISDYDTLVFEPTGTALPTGIITLWGTEDQIDAIARNEERIRLQVRASLIVEGLVETRSVRGAAVLEGIVTFQEAVSSLS